MKVAVLGSGNGGHAVAYEFAKAGNDVYMYDFKEFPKNIAEISKAGGITSEGDLEGFAKISYAGHDVEKVISNADIIFIVAPANAAVPFANECKPYVKPGQIYVMCPGSCFGAIEFKLALGLDFEDDSVIMAETSTLPYAARISGAAKVKVPNRLKGGYFIAAFPSKYNEKVYDIVSKVYPEIEIAENIIKTALQNANPIIHPSIMLSNLARTENKEKWEFYRDGVTEGVGRIIKSLDLERIEIGKQFGVKIIPDPVLGLTQGYMADETYDNGYSKAPGFKGILAPITTNHRYFNEDVNGLCLWEDMANHFGIKTPAITTVIDMASIVRGVNYREMKTKTMNKLGLEKYNLDQLKEIL
jgi:opine dehydrogenase